MKQLGRKIGQVVRKEEGYGEAKIVQTEGKGGQGGTRGRGVAGDEARGKRTEGKVR